MPAIVLVFGEDETDSKAIAFLSEAINEAQAEARTSLQTKVLRDPPVLRRDASRLKLRSQAEKIAGFVRGYGHQNTIVVAIAHRDCDEVEPEHERCAAELHADLTRAGVERAVIAAPAWEIEAWWMLFPDALANVRACWRRIDYGRSNVGSIPNAKERLTRDLRPTGSARMRCADYQERDGVKVARYIKDNGLNNLRREATSQSFDRFSSDLLEALT